MRHRITSFRCVEARTKDESLCDRTQDLYSRETSSHFAASRFGRGQPKVINVTRCGAISATLRRGCRRLARPGAASRMVPMFAMTHACARASSPSSPSAAWALLRLAAYPSARFRTGLHRRLRDTASSWLALLRQKGANQLSHCGPCRTGKNGELPTPYLELDSVGNCRYVVCQHHLTFGKRIKCTVTVIPKALCSRKLATSPMQRLLLAS